MSSLNCHRLGPRAPAEAFSVFNNYVALPRSEVFPALATEGGESCVANPRRRRSAAEYSLSWEEGMEFGRAVRQRAETVRTWWWRARAPRDPRKELAGSEMNFFRRRGRYPGAELNSRPVFRKWFRVCGLTYL